MDDDEDGDEDDDDDDEEINLTFDGGALGGSAAKARRNMTWTRPGAEASPRVGASPRGGAQEGGARAKADGGAEGSASGQKAAQVVNISLSTPRSGGAGGGSGAHGTPRGIASALKRAAPAGGSGAAKGVGAKTTAYDFDLETLEEKPWLKPGEPSSPLASPATWERARACRGKRCTGLWRARQCPHGRGARTLRRCEG